MTITGTNGPSTSPQLALSNSQAQIAQSAAQIAANKGTEARAEARAGINDGDEAAGLGQSVNKLA